MSNAGTTAALSPRDTKRFAKQAVADAKSRAGRGWDLLGAEVQEALVLANVAYLAMGWVREETIAVSAVNQVSRRALALLQGERS